MVNLSIIVPNYNGEGFMGETLKSILNQSYQDYEVLVIDDGSTDHSASVVAELGDERFKFIALQHQGAPGHCRNHGIDIAQGKYIMFFDNDDLMYPQMLAKMYNEITDKQCDVVIGNFENYNVVTKQKYAVENVDFYTLEHPTYNDLFTINPFPCNKLYNLAFIRGSQVRYLEGLFNQDLGFFLSLIMKKPRFSIVSEPLMEYHIRPNSITTSTKTRKKHLDILKIYDQVFEAYEQCNDKALYTYGFNEMFIKTMMYKASYFNPLKDQKELKEIRSYLYQHRPNWYKMAEFKNFYSKKKRLYNRLLMQYQWYLPIGLYKSLKGRKRK